MSGMRVLTPSRALACLDIFPNINRIKKVQSPVMVIHGMLDEEGTTIDQRGCTTKMQIFVRNCSGETLAVQTAAADTIGRIKAQVGADDACTVTWSGFSLTDECLIGSQVQEGSTLHLVPLLMGGGDGTPAMGKKHTKTHGLCPRCGKRAFHYQKKTCASCGYPAKKMRSYNWCKKSHRKRCPGTGRMAYLKTMTRRFKNGFREGTTPPPRKKNRASQS